MFNKLYSYMIFSTLLCNYVFATVNVTNVMQKEESVERKSDTSIELEFSQSIYERLVYFSKACALTSCITSNSLIEDRTLDEGGCPPQIKFCHDEEENPTVSRTRVELVLEAENGELGTGYVMVDHGRQVIIMAFRSSTTNQDWFSDFTILPTTYKPVCKNDYLRLIKKGEIKECKGCKIHRGFHKFTETLSRHFLKKMERILEKYPHFHVVIVGHSLGAAMASIAGIELRLRGYNPLVITYAPPKIFNKKMQEWVDDLFHTHSTHKRILETGEIDFDHGYFRVVHNQDYIPMVPPFYHVAGLEIFIKKIELPHSIQDLEYLGPVELPKVKKAINSVFSGFVDEWLHTYEHRSYFIDLNGCSGF